MRNLFEQSSFYWTRYERYDLKTAKNGLLFIMPSKDAKPEVYNPLKTKEQMALDALNIGMASISRKSAGKIQRSVLRFVTHYSVFHGF